MNDKAKELLKWLSEADDDQIEAAYNVLVKHDLDWVECLVDNSEYTWI